MSSIKIAQFSPSHILCLIMCVMIFCGAMLLALPFCHTTPLSFLDLVFTATSATCVAGLFTIPLESFTPLGQMVILCLSQIGGIGLITLTIFLLSFFVNFGFASQLVATQLLQLEGWKNIRVFIGFIIGLTLFFEACGMLVFFILYITELPFKKALFFSAFGAVSSFCNTGIVIPSGSSISYSTSMIMSLTASCLMIFGSLGFVTWNEIIHYIRARNNNKRYLFSLHSKIILYGTLFVIVTMYAAFLILEWDNTLVAFPQESQKFVYAFFQAVSARSAGFTTPLFYFFRLPTLLLILLAAFIGGSPASTSGGVKITTLALVWATMRSAVTGRESTDIQGRSLPLDQVYKAITIVLLSILWIIGTTFLLTITEQGPTLEMLFFEASSAFCTLGLSLGTTKLLSVYGKLIIIATMIIGRIGSLTLILALKAVATRNKQEGIDFSYPEERVILS